MHTYIHTYMDTYTYIHTCIHTHMHTYTHTYMHSFIVMLLHTAQTVRYSGNQRESRADLILRSILYAQHNTTHHTTPQHNTLTSFIDWSKG